MKPVDCSWQFLVIAEIGKMEFKSFETERLIVRPTSEEDAAFIFELANTPKWLQYIGDRNIGSVESAREYIETKMLPQLHRLGYSSYTLIRKIDQQKVGVCGLYDRDGLPGIDLGFAVLPAFEGLGFAFEASHRVQQAAFEDFQLRTLCAITTKDNVASQKLLEKLGMRQTGTTSLPDDEEELLVYEISLPTQ